MFSILHCLYSFNFNMFCIVTSVKLCVFCFRLAQSESVQFFQFEMPLERPN